MVYCRFSQPNLRNHDMDILLSALSGIRTGLCPIGLVIVAALFTYRICDETGAMAKIRRALSSVSSDPVVLMLLVVWGFGNFMEGIAGFGTAVAIPAAILYGFGMDGVKAIGICLIGNTIATGHGAVGVPMVTLAKTANLDTQELTAVATQLLAAGMLPIPFLLVAFQEGWRKLPKYLPVCLVAALAMAVPCFFIARTMGPELPAVLGGLLTMAAIAVFRPRGAGGEKSGVSARELLVAAAPFLGVVVLLSLYALALPKAVKAQVTPGAVILAGALCGALVQRVPARTMGRVALASLKQAKRALVTICLILAVAKMLETVGAISFLAELVVKVFGKGYAFLATAVGVCGGALTGSGTNSCVLFGALQRDAAASLGFDPKVFAGANILGAGIGKMICPQSLAIGLAACGLAGCEGKVLRRVMPYFVAVVAAACAFAGLVALLRPQAA